MNDSGLAKIWRNSSAHSAVPLRVVSAEKIAAAGMSTFETFLASNRGKTKDRTGSLW